MHKVEIVPLGDEFAVYCPSLKSYRTFNATWTKDSADPDILTDTREGASALAKYYNWEIIQPFLDFDFEPGFVELGEPVSVLPAWVESWLEVVDTTPPMLYVFLILAILGIAAVWSFASGDRSPETYILIAGIAFTVSALGLLVFLLPEGNQKASYNHNN